MGIQDLEAVIKELRDFVDLASYSWNGFKSPTQLFHYSSMEGFLGIASSKAIWASDMLSLNDASEASYPYEVIAEAFENQTSVMLDAHRQAFKTQLTEYLFRMYTPFVTCFCEDGDLLSQWRGYGGNGEGFAIGFSASWLASLDRNKWRL